MLPRARRFVRHLSPEAWAWAAGLVALGLADPAAEGLLSLCLFKHLGIAWCPGCGLGHGVAFLLDGQWRPALAAHPLAPFALVVLAGRVASLVRQAARGGPLRRPVLAPEGRAS